MLAKQDDYHYDTLGIQEKSITIEDSRKKPVIEGLVFNSADESRMIIVPKELLQEMIPESMRKA